MSAGDFRSNEVSLTIEHEDDLTITHTATDGTSTVMVDSIPVQAGEIVDATFMSKKALLTFLDQQVEDAGQQGVLYSLHLKATMMKISDPIIFGHAVTSFFKPVFEKHGDAFKSAGANVNNGFDNLLKAIQNLPADQRTAIEADIQSVYESRPDIAMVNSDKGITNLHVPSDVIVDASMPAMIRSSGQMWNKLGDLQDTKCIIPDSSYADLYQKTIEYHKDNGAFNPSTMGTCPNVGLMAQKAEEYLSLIHI